MNQATRQDEQNIVFTEYSKDAIAFYNGHGTLFHTVKASCKDTRNALIEHRFGQDEGKNNQIMRSSLTLKEAHQVYLLNTPPPNDGDYRFGLAAMEPPGFIPFEEIQTLGNERKFRINWEKSFGIVKEAQYIWLWDKIKAFPVSENQTQHSSLLKVAYPTKKLIFRLIVNYLYPIKGNPYICVIDPKGEETVLMQVVPVELKNEKLSFNYHTLQPCKCFKIEIDNPLLNYTYEMRWISDKNAWTKAIN